MDDKISHSKVSGPTYTIAAQNSNYRNVVGAKVIQAKMGDSLMYSPYIVQYNSQQQLPGFVPSRIVLFTNFTIVSHLQVCQKNLVK